MKKVKVMLSAIAVFAVIGGALAFKAKDTQRTFYTIDPVDGNCTSTTSLLSTTTIQAAVGTFVQLATGAQNGACPVIKLTTSN